MTEDPSRGDDQLDSWTSPGPNNVKLIWFLYLLSLVLGITSIVGLVFAYLNRGKAGGWVESHYTYQIRTFWIGLLYVFASIILAFLLIGFLLMIAVAVWFIVRIVIGLQRAAQAQPIDNPQSWLI
jgi:uncharacterized membrane protein